MDRVTPEAVRTAYAAVAKYGIVPTSGHYFRYVDSDDEDDPEIVACCPLGALYLAADDLASGQFTTLDIVAAKDREAAAMLRAEVADLVDLPEDYLVGFTYGWDDIPQSAVVRAIKEPGWGIEAPEQFRRGVADGRDVRRNYSRDGSFRDG